MKIKSIIAVFMTFLLLGKVISIDAGLFSMVLESQDISLVNSYCEIGYFSDGADQQHKLNEAAEQHQLHIDFLCQTHAQLAVVEWDSHSHYTNFDTNTYLSPIITEVRSDRFDPPPRA